MIYTSYYGNIKNIPKDYTLISISGAISDEIRNLVNSQDKSLAPSKEIYFNYKASNDWQEYTKAFLDKVKYIDLYEKFNMFLGDKHAVILCYETPYEFCHRHIVAELIENNLNTTVKELNHNHLIRHNYKMITNNTKDWE